MRAMIVFLIGLIVPFAAYAHSSGESLERQVGDYLIDVGYEPAALMAGDRAVFDFSLKDANGRLVDFDYLWVRVQGRGQTILATGIHRAEVGATSLLYAISRDMEGDMSLSIRYHRGEEVLAETDFILPVAPYEDSMWWWPFAWVGGLGAVLGGGISLLWKKRRLSSDTL